MRMWFFLPSSSAEQSCSTSLSDSLGHFLMAGRITEAKNGKAPIKQRGAAG
jgi:hypothetical protein